jgi:hypothetical protein
LPSRQPKPFVTFLPHTEEIKRHMWAAKGKPEMVDVRPNRRVTLGGHR